MVTSLGNAPSQPKGNSFTDCPASLAEYLATMAGADRIELPSRILEIRSIAISPRP